MQPTFDAETARLTERIARRITGFEVDSNTWVPFVKSLEHSILSQTAPDDIKHIDMPMDVIYGTYDTLVIRGKTRHIFGDKANITAHTIRERHMISPKASRFIANRILAADQPEAHAYQQEKKIR